jgi:hypothetical protein
MDIYDKIIEFLEKPEEETKDKAPEGICALCWGYQAYDKQIRKIIEDKQIDVNNHRHKYTRIQKLLKEQIEGIKLKEGEIQDCPTCSGQQDR